MTRWITTAILFTLFHGAVLSAQEQVQRSFIVKRTATWCSICGSTAWDIMSDLVEAKEDQAVILSAHHSASSNLHHPDASALIDGMEASFGQPVFFHNGNNVGGGSATTETALNNLIAQTATELPLAQTALSLGYDSEQELVWVTAEVQFFEATTGSYQLALYLVEKEVVGFQQNRGPDAVHKRVLREALTDDVFGEPIAGGPIAADDRFLWEGTADVSGYELENLQIAAVLWQAAGDGHTYVNAMVSDQFELLEPTAVRINRPDSWQDRILGMAGGDLQLEVDTGYDHPRFRIDLLDAGGRMLAILFEGMLPAGRHRWAISRAGHLPPGIYWLRMQSASQLRTKKLLIR